MSASLYLENYYLLEELQAIDENVSSWLRSISPKGLVNAIDKGVKQKDPQIVKAVLEKMPKVEFQKLYSMATIANSNISNAFTDVKFEMSKKFKNINSRQLDYLSLAFATTIATKPDTKKAAKETVVNIEKHMKKVGVKKFGGDGSLGMGLILLVVAGAFVMASITTISLIPLLIALGIVGVSMAVAIG